MKVLGIDIGSTVAKFAIYQTENQELKLFSYRVNGDPINCIENALRTNKELESYTHMAVTGSSRNLIAEKFNAILIKPEIIAHVYGIWSQNIFPDIIIEIGGQDSKLILLNKNIVSNFRMNSNCAAGTGAFIESQARRYNISVDELDFEAQTSMSEIQLNAKCATFLESALIDLQRKGIPKNAIYMSIFNSLCNNYLSSMAQDIDWNVFKNIVFIGGVARLSSMKTCFEKLLGKKIFVPNNCEYMGSIGMVKLLLENMDQSSNDKMIPADNGVKQCFDCDNRCVLKKIKLNDGNAIYVGGLCQKHNYVD